MIVCRENLIQIRSGRFCYDLSHDGGVAFFDHSHIVLLPGAGEEEHEYLASRLLGNFGGNGGLLF